MKKLALIIVMCFVALQLFAQKEQLQHRTDSLISLFKPNTADTSQCLRCCQISTNYRQLNPNEAVNWAKKALEQSKKIGYLKGEQCAYNSLGMAYYGLSKYTESINAFEQYKTVCQSMNDSGNIAWAYNNIGNVYIDLPSYSTTLLYYDSALQIRKLLGDSHAIAKSYTNFGYIYKELGNYTLALLNLFNALKILENKNDENSLAHTYDFIGAIYAHKKNYAYSIFFSQKALALYVKNTNRNGQAIALNCIGSNYYSMGKQALGKQYLKQALSIYVELNDSRQLAIISSTLSEIYLNEHQVDSAIMLAQQSIAYHKKNDNQRQAGDAHLKLAMALQAKGNYAQALKQAEIAEQITASNGEQSGRVLVYDRLSAIHAQLGNYNKAYAYKTKHQLLKDSLLNESTEKSIAEMQTKYETEKKDLELSKQQIAIKGQVAEIAKRRWQLVLLVTLLCACVALSYLIYNRTKLKQKVALDALQLKQQEDKNKAIIQAEERERIRIARELHDGIGQQLSAAKMNLSAFENKLSTQQKDSFALVVQLVDDAVKEVRSVSHNMMPNALLRSGLASAVRDFVNKLSISDTLKIDLQIVGLSQRLEATTETVLYRVMQECVSNIIKHAAASQISIQLVQHDAHLNLTIEDNGKGFDVNDLTKFEGIGIKNMTSRVEFLNGTIHFDSTQGRGTTIMIDVPLK